MYGIYTLYAYIINYQQLFTLLNYKLFINLIIIIDSVEKDSFKV